MSSNRKSGDRRGRPHRITRQEIPQRTRILPIPSKRTFCSFYYRKQNERNDIIPKTEYFPKEHEYRRLFRLFLFRNSPKRTNPRFTVKNVKCVKGLGILGLPYSAMFNQSCQHHNSCGILLPNHPPEVVKGTGYWP